MSSLRTTHPMTQISQLWSIAFSHFIGYALLIITLFDVIDAFIPPAFMNPNWEFQLFGSLVERAVVPLVGIVFVFYGGLECRRGWEKFLLKLISWFCLLVSLLFLLTIPLGVSAALRIDRQNDSQATAQYRQSIAQLKQVENQFQATSDQDLNALLEQSKKRGQLTKIDSVEALRSILPTELNKAKQSLSAQTIQLRESQRLALRKSAFKWTVGALVSATAFFYAWLVTRWTRTGVL